VWWQKNRRMWKSCIPKAEATGLVNASVKTVKKGRVLLSRNVYFPKTPFGVFFLLIFFLINVYYIYGGNAALLDDGIITAGMYFACIMMMCSLSVVFTVLVLNLHYRSPGTHRMPAWVTHVIIYTVSQKTSPFLFLWYLSQISSDSANFWHKHAPGNLKETHVHAQFIVRFICSYCTL